MPFCVEMDKILFINLLNPSTCPWALGWMGVMRLCLNPASFANSVKACELKGGPLSVWSVSGTPCVEKTFLSFFLTTSSDVDLVNSTSGYLEYWSVITRAYSPLGKGPQKSASIVAHGLVGSCVILGGSVWWVFVAIWHSKQRFTESSMRMFMPGHQYLCLIISFVFDRPRCPCLWAMRTMRSLRFSGGMILFSLKMTSSDSYSSACRSAYGFRIGSFLFHIPDCMLASGAVMLHHPWFLLGSCRGWLPGRFSWLLCRVVPLWSSLSLTGGGVTCSQSCSLSQGCGSWWSRDFASSWRVSLFLVAALLEGCWIVAVMVCDQL